VSILVKYPRPFDLTKVDRNDIISKLKSRLQSRVIKAFLFGSFAVDKHKPDSDIDIVLVVDTSKKFTERALDFLDLFDVYPQIDILVYTPEEFERKINEINGFGAEMKTTLKQLI